MSALTNFYHWVMCEECGGTCRVLRHGPHYIDSVPCMFCVIGLVKRRMTREEVLAALGSVTETSDPGGGAA